MAQRLLLLCSMRSFLFCLFAGCAIAGSGSNGDLEPITIKEPPDDRDSNGNATSPGCDGVTKKGDCEGDMAVKCDVLADEVVEVDCTKNDLVCVKDAERGAICREPIDGGGGSSSGGSGSGGGGGGGGGGSTSGAPCTSGATAYGKCEGSVAIWCTEEGNTQTWDCSKSGLACKLDDCESGAYCCEGEGGGAGGGGGGGGGGGSSSQCDAIGNYGICTSTTSLQYCNTAGQIVTVQCTGGETCGDVSGAGVYCIAPTSGCGDLATYGPRCDGDYLHYCNPNTNSADSTDCTAFGGICSYDAFGTAACI